ncbi:MAG: FkbM family methyltransferase [Myxococcales bacterium]|nr:FkbM family methyltransferase [Myxococcales bacterium]
MIRELLYKSRLRSWMRQTGLTSVVSKIIHYPARQKRQKEIDQYERNRPKTVEVGFKQARCRLRVNNLQEYLRALSYQQDQHLIEALLSHLKEGGDVWDIGSNFGLYGLILAASLDHGKKGSVYAFEPEPWCQARLQENIDENAFKHVEVVPIALADQDGEMFFQVAQGGAVGGASHLLREGEATSSDTIKVQVTTGDALLKERDLPVPAVIKVDVEGFEWEVLQGLQHILAQPQCRFVLVEVHFSVLEGRGLSQAPAEIESLFKRSGFRTLQWLDASHLTASK